MSEMKKGITIGEKYNPAMKITDQAEADAYFGACVRHTMLFDKTREEAEKVERINLGYWAGYYSHEIRLRVERLFNCTHPLFGPAKDGEPTPEEGIKMGQDFAEGKLGPSGIPWSEYQPFVSEP